MQSSPTRYYRGIRGTEGKEKQVKNNSHMGVDMTEETISIVLVFYLLIHYAVDPLSQYHGHHAPKSCTSSKEICHPGMFQYVQEIPRD